MKDYLNYHAEDFAQDDFFIGWVTSTSIAAETFWQNWLETYPFKRNEVEAARQLVLITQNLPTPDLPDSEIHALKESIFEKIAEIENRKTSLWSFIPTWAAAAAVSGLLALAGWYTFSDRTPGKVAYTQLVSKAAEKYALKEVENKTKTAVLVNLPDGSSAILRKGSKLSYPNHFGADSREIFLTGEAFFEIAKDPEKPFFVYANEIVTKVLGTSFNVRAYQGDKEIRVTVKTGRVSVYKAESAEAKVQLDNKRIEGLVLLPNQQAVFSNREIEMVAKTKETETVSKVPEIAQMTFEYSETPIAEIFTQLEKAYNIRFVYDPSVMGKCPVTASLTGEPLTQKLDLVCKAIRAKYELTDGTVTITGKGCE